MAEPLPRLSAQDSFGCSVPWLIPILVLLRANDYLSADGVQHGPGVGSLSLPGATNATAMPL
jgi:hypothetical protein